MKPIPSLIPRFNKDYNFNDFICSLRSVAEINTIKLIPLHHIFGDTNFFFTNTGRTSLYVILRALNLPKGSKVGVPLYSCTVVFDAIIKAGCVPAFIDIDLDNYTLDPEDLAEKISNLSAVIVIHTFGRPAEMNQIKKVAGDVPVIEDCAHSLLSEYKGMTTGTIGTASFFSLSKYISAGDGGMIVLNERGLKDRFQMEIDLLSKPPILSEVKHAVFTCMLSMLCHKPLYGIFTFPIGSHIVDKVDVVGNKGFKTAEKIRNGDFSIFLRKSETFREKVELQRKNSHALLKRLKDTSLILPYEKEDTYCNYYLFPIRFDNKRERDVAHMDLRVMGVDTAKLWSMTPLTARQMYGYIGDCPNTEILADTILTIPNHYTLANRELLKIGDAVNKIGESS